MTKISLTPDALQNQNLTADNTDHTDLRGLGTRSLATSARDFARGFPPQQAKIGLAGAWLDARKSAQLAKIAEHLSISYES